MRLRGAAGHPAVAISFTNIRDALRKACLQKGPGTLVHPDYGSVSVLCDSISVREELSSQGMAVFELTFVEAGAQAIPETSIDMSDSVLSSASALTDAARNGFASGFSLSQGVAGLTSLVGNIADVCTSSLNSIGSGLEYAEGLRSDLTGAMNQVVDAVAMANDLKSSAESLLNTPDALAAQLDTVFSVVASMAGTSPDSFNTVRNLTSQSNASETASVSNDDAKAEKLCMQKIEQLTKQVVVAKEAEIITQIEFDNADDASSVLENFVADTEEVELFEDIEPSDEIMQALRTTRENVVEYVREIILELPRMRTIRVPEHMPSRVLAYDLYEDLDRADEIVKKNKIPYPAFVPAGKDLKVLSE